MAWTNVFDVGACALQVWKWDGLEYVQMTAPEMEADGVSIQEAAGQVTLVTPETSAEYIAVIVPSFATNGALARLINMSCDYEMNSMGAILAANIPTDGPSINLTVNPPDVTPDPLQFPPVANWACGGLRVQAQGGA